jgi:class 3 adenylate cyclase
MGANVAAVATPSEQQAERAESVIMIAELRNFTRMSEMLEPDRVLALVDEFFECAAIAVAEHGGLAMAVHNDSLVAAFRRGAPPDLALSAVRAAQHLFGEFDAKAQTGGGGYEAFLRRRQAAAGNRRSVFRAEVPRSASPAGESVLLGRLRPDRGGEDRWTTLISGLSINCAASV